MYTILSNSPCNHGLAAAAHPAADLVTKIRLAASTRRFGGASLRFRRTALAQIVRAVGYAVRSRRLDGGLFAGKFCLGPEDVRQLVLRAILQGDLLARDKKYLSQ